MALPPRKKKLKGPNLRQQMLDNLDDGVSCHYPTCLTMESCPVCGRNKGKRFKQ